MLNYSIVYTIQRKEIIKYFTHELTNERASNENLYLEWSHFIRMILNKNILTFKKSESYMN